MLTSFLEVFWLRNSMPIAAALMSLSTLLAIFSGLMAPSLIRSEQSALSQQMKDDLLSFVEVLESNLENQNARLSTLQSDTEDMGRSIKSIGGSQKLMDALFSSLNTIRKTADSAKSLNEDSMQSVRALRRELEQSTQRAEGFDLSFISTAHAKRWLPNHKSKNDVAPATTQTHNTKLDRLVPFLWAFLAIPLLIGAWSMFLIRSIEADVRGFGMCMMTAVFGYYAGIGASLFALAAV